jgi:hypothetical protein
MRLGDPNYREGKGKEMKFIAIKPKDKKLAWIEVDTLKIAELSVGLSKVNHGLF